METLAESGVTPHSQFPASSYYPKTATLPYYTNGGASMSPQPYNNYSGYKSGSEVDVSHSGQPGALSPHKYKYSKEIDQDGLKLHSSNNLLPQYYHYNMHQLPSSHVPHFKRNFPKEITGHKSDKDLLDDNFPRRKQKNDDNDGEGQDVGHSPRPVYVNTRQDDDRLYSVGRDMSVIGNRQNKFMQVGHAYKSQHSSAENHPSDYSVHSSWRQTSASSGDMNRFHKEVRLSSDDQSNDISTIKSEDNMTYGRLESQAHRDGAGSDLRQVTNSESPFNGPYLKQNKSGPDQGIPDLKVDSRFNPTNFVSYNEQSLNREKDRSVPQTLLNQDPVHNADMIKNEAYASKLFARHNSFIRSPQSKGIMSPTSYTRDAKSNQWLDRLHLHPSQEFHDNLRSPTKVMPNYPYSSTPGKNHSSEELTCRDEWKNCHSKALPSNKGGMLNDRHGIDDGGDPTLPKVINTSPSSDHKDEDSKSPSPIKSASTPNTRQHYSIIDSPNNCASRKSVEPESICDLKESVSYNDDSLLSKKEVLSDDGCEDSPYPGTRSHSSLSPPSPDSSMTYPPQFPHPYFASPVRGHPSVQRLQFESPRGHHEGPQAPGLNFHFDKNYTGRFHLPDLAPEMPMGGPYIGPLPPNIAQNADKDLYFCHLCSYSGKSKPEFDSHMNVHFEFNCPHCDYTSRTEGRLKRHIKDFHSDDSSRRALPGRPKVYKCKQCSFSATEKDKFWEHARTHIKEDKLIQCPHCAFVTEYKHHLEYHLRNHFNSKPYKCNKCNYSCVNKSMLNSHMKSHTNVYQYRCSNCTYATKYCHSLKLHLRKYNHKPATVLNQDGSIPLGLDVESSGIAVVAKRGPPRGPRGPRKDKRETYSSQMFGMSHGQMGMNPMLNGMMPYWPVLGHMANLPSHVSPCAGMLPGIGNFSHPMRRSSDGDGCRSLSDSDKLDIIDNSSDDEMGQLRDDEFACRLCSFVGENTEALCIHFVQVHKDEARDVARACGVSEENLAASLSRQIPEMMAGMKRMSEPLTESDSEPSDYTPAKSTLERSPDCTVVSAEQTTPGSNLYSPGWPSSFSENRDAHSYTQVSSSEEQKDNSGEIDILQQMTLKFGSGTFLPHQPPAVLEEERMQKESPLDLTKPKSVSPKEVTSPLSDTDQHPASIGPQADQLFRKRVIQEDVMEEHSADVTTPVPRKRSRKGKAYKLDTLCMKLQERQISPVADSEESHSDPDIHLERFQPLHPTSEIETLHLDKSEEKLDCQARETTRLDVKGRRGCLPSTSSKSDDEDTDEYEMNDDDEGRSSFEKGEEERMEDAVDRAVDKNTSSEMDSEFEKLQRSLTILNNGIDPESDGHRSDHLSSAQKHLKNVTNLNSRPPEDADEINLAGKMELVCQKEDVLVLQTAEDEQRGTSALTSEKPYHEDESKSTSSNFFVPDDQNLNSDKTAETIVTPLNPDEAVHSCQLVPNSEQDNKHHHTESDMKVNTAVSDTEIQNVEPNAGSLSPKACLQTETLKASSCQETKTENQKAEDIYGSKEEISEIDQKETVDPVEMINTVIENRKKPVPPAVRRGTELAWKLLHDPVNPVTSLPLPIDSPPLPHSQMTAPKPNCPPLSHSQMTAPKPNCSPALIMTSSSLVRNNMRHFTPRAYPSQRPIPPIRMHMPLPPTPMAFIPPTSHMMPEPPPLVRPIAPPPGKLVKPEEYSCNYCGLSFQDCVMYTVHMGYHSNRNPFKCNSCGVVCRDKVDFFLHIARSPHA